MKTGWKPKAVALIVALRMNLNEKVQALIAKYLGYKHIDTVQASLAIHDVETFQATLAIHGVDTVQASLANMVQRHVKPDWLHMIEL